MTKKIYLETLKSVLDCSILHYWRTKNRDNLTKGGLIISHLKSESSNVERNCMKQFNNNTHDDDDDDDKIRDKISDIRMILGRLRNTVANNYIKKVRRMLHEIEKKESLSD